MSGAVCGTFPFNGKLLGTWRHRIAQESPIKNKMAFPLSGARGPDPLKRVFFWGTTVLPPTGAGYIDRAAQRSFDGRLQRPYPTDKSDGGETR